tara:strand:+ start:431 stop:634 length:204 start_codon:yes stop_codon:yes gene_type:complete
MTISISFHGDDETKFKALPSGTTHKYIFARAKNRAGEVDMYLSYELARELAETILAALDADAPEETV